MNDFKNQECSACTHPSVTVSTEILSVDPNTKAIKKAYIFRCRSHIDVSVEEMLALRQLKCIHVDTNDIEFTIIESEKITISGVNVGVRAKHVPTGIIVQCTEKASQYQNKLGVIELLKRELLNSDSL